MSTQGSSDQISYAHQIWRVARWIILLLAASYIADVIYAYPQDVARHASVAMVTKIGAAKITEADVDGNDLPSPPDPSQVDATVVGVDANDNGIRDDVELAIFANYPTSTAIRSAELQYAMDEQMFLSDVFDQYTWRAVAQQGSRGYACISDAYTGNDLKESLIFSEQHASEVDSLVFNTPARQKQRDHAFSYEMSYESSNATACDVDPTKGQ